MPFYHIIIMDASGGLGKGRMIEKQGQKEKELTHRSREEG
jgi:hypothetical protein